MKQQLQLAFAADEAEDAALSHPRLLGEAADGEALEPLDRGVIDRGTGDGGARLGDG
jgi:hypothetical protein